MQLAMSLLPIISIGHEMWPNVVKNASPLIRLHSNSFAVRRGRIGEPGKYRFAPIGVVSARLFMSQVNQDTREG